MRGCNSGSDMKISVITTSHGQARFKVDGRLGGKRIRKYFESHHEAEAAVDNILRDSSRIGDLFAKLKESTRIELYVASEEAATGGFNVRQAVDHYTTWLASKRACPTVKEAVEDCLDAKEDDGYRKRSLTSLDSTLRRFAKKHGARRIDEITRSDIRAWLLDGRKPDGAPWSCRTRNNYLIDLATLFSWAVEEELLGKSPAKMKKFRPNVAEEAALGKKEILNNDEVERILRLTLKHDPALLGYVVLVIFAGLRPEREAPGVTWDDIDLDENLLYVSAKIAKDRKERYIEMPPALALGLKESLRLGADLPTINRVRRWESIRKKAGLFGDTWPHDAGRHTFASNHLVKYGEAATKTALGHGTYDMLFLNYRTLVKPREASAFWEIAGEVFSASSCSQLLLFCCIGMQLILQTTAL